MNTGMNFVCNYAVLRFLPYPETEEFVNLGIVLYCAERGFLGVKYESQKFSRVTDFFPELQLEKYKAALHAMGAELARLERREAREPHQREQLRLVFRELIRPRESIFRFSGIKTVLTSDPEGHLQTLFNEYVLRHTVQPLESHEGEMSQP